MDLTTLAMVNANDEGDISPLECMVKAVDTLRNELHVHSADDNYLPGMVREVVLPDARAGQRDKDWQICTFDHEGIPRGGTIVKVKFRPLGDLKFAMQWKRID